ncbi:MAG: metal-dependent transcriptional regulator [Flavobacteriales bacterium]|nr:metal-dependent transcriptional regulator [Flavobacteriales bacterium]
MQTQTEENYLKHIYRLTGTEQKKVSTSELASELKINSASVTEKLQRMSKKKLIEYEKSKGVTLTLLGKEIAIQIIRKHRIWETFLVDTLNFNWDEVHEIAEQLEHIKSDKLTNKLDEYLNYPRFDPHGDPIPDKNGTINQPCFENITSLKENTRCKIASVKRDDSKFLNFFEKLGLNIGDYLQILSIEEYDSSMLIRINDKKEIYISSEFAKNIKVTQKEDCCMFNPSIKRCS